jgi:prepilin-type N-terminal cleavage/methylation domain-containing protein/prepilin-type processing-associated H-X9-DG protein
VKSKFREQIYSMSRLPSIVMGVAGFYLGKNGMPPRSNCPSPLRVARCRTGFSLIELLAVISVVAILMAIILPVVGIVRERAQASSCMSSLRQIGSAWQIYCVDNPTTGLIPYDTTSTKYWSNYLLGRPNGTVYISDDSVPQCPAWERNSEVSRWGGYAMTDLILWNPARRVRQEPYFYPAMLEKPADWPVFMDADKPVVYGLDNPTEDADGPQRWSARHNGYAHVLMADQHIEIVQYGDTRWSQNNLNDGTHF